MPAQLGYWKIRGLAQPIRFLLQYVGEEYENKMYEVTDGPDFNRDSWLKIKESMGLDYPNLPYFIDGDIKVTQSNAILRYIGRKHDMCGSTEQERVLVDVMENEAMDFRNGMVRLAYNKNFKDMKDDYIKNVKARINRYENYLKDKKFFAGEKVTFVDFPMYEMLYQHNVLDSSLLEDCKNLKAFLERIEGLPKIKAYMASENYPNVPFNNKMASFGNTLL